MSVDRISELPDDHIHKILSYVNAKHVVQTSVLSKRWRYLWTSITTLNLEFGSYPLSNKDGINSKIASFRRFVLNLLSRNCCMDIQNFRYLFFEDFEHFYDLGDVLLHATKRKNVREVFIETSDSLPWNWCNLFSAWTLLTKINMAATFARSNGIPLYHMNLKSLNLLYLNYDIIFVSGNILANCPKLETVAILGVEISDNVRICANKLRVMELYAYVPFDSNTRITLATPVLTSLKIYFSTCLPLVYAQEDLSCIESVEIIIMLEGGLDVRSWDQKQEIIRNLIAMFKVIGNAKSLVLSLKLAELLSTSPDWIQHKFALLPNLRRLKLKTEKTGDVKLPIEFSQKAFSSLNEVIVERI